MRTHSGTSAWAKAVIAKSLQKGGLSNTWIPHQDNFKKAIRHRRTAFLLKKVNSWVVLWIREQMCFKLSTSLILTFMLVSLPTGWPLGDVGVSHCSTLPFACFCGNDDTWGYISLITKSMLSSLSETSSCSSASETGIWAWQSFSKWGRWSSSIEMILRRWPLSSDGQDGWHDQLATFCLEVSPSLSSL